MSSAPDRDYDIQGVRRVRPRGHDFSLAITPRYELHYVTRDYEPLSARLLRALARRRRLLVDVGAHAGFYTALAALAHPDNRVIAIEPIEENRFLLRQTIAANGIAGRVDVVEAAASPGAGAAVIGLADVLGERADLAGALVRVSAGGHELGVLAGLEKVLTRDLDLRLLVDFHPTWLRVAGTGPEALLEALQGFGFEVFLVDDAQRRFVRVQRANAAAGCIGPDAKANLYCVPRERALAVAFFSHSSFLNGAERSLLETVESMVEDHGAVCTVVLPGEGPLGPRLAEAGAATALAEMPWWCGFGDLAPAEYALRAERGAAGMLRDVLPCLEAADPDVIESATLTNPWGAVAASLLDRPHVWRVHEYGERSHGLGFFAPLESIAESVAGSSNLVITASANLRRHLFARVPEAQCRTLGSWVAPPMFTDLSRPGDGDVTGRRRRLAVLASIGPGKDQATAVRALALLCARGLDVELVCAGHGERESFEALWTLAATLGVADRVAFPGEVEDPYTVLAWTDVLLSCSPHEAFGRTPVEAALAGRPSVVGASSGVAEILRHDIEALHAVEGDPHDIARQIEALLTDPERAARMATAARARVVEVLDRTRMGGQHFAWLCELRQSSPPLGGPLIQRLVVATAQAARRLAEANAGWRDTERREAADHIARLETARFGEQERARRREETLAAQLHRVTGTLAWRLYERTLALPGARRLARVVGRLGRGASAESGGT